jgi:hypothetical protein
MDRIFGESRAAGRPALWQDRPGNRRIPMILRIVLIALHTVIGLAAVGAGLALVSDPTGEGMSFDVDWLRGSPFRDYAFPGLFLMIVIGAANLISAVALALRVRWGAIIILASGLLLMAWISIQWFIIGFRHWTQVFWVVVLAALTALAGLNLRRNRRLPLVDPRGQ